MLLAAPLGLRAKSSVAARNATLLAGMAALIGADLCFAFLPSWPGECTLDVWRVRTKLCAAGFALKSRSWYACRCASSTNQPTVAPSPSHRTPGILSGALLLGLHMAATHGVSVAMLSSYIPAQPVPGLGRLSGTAWALTDLLLGERHCHAHAH